MAVGWGLEYPEDGSKALGPPALWGAGAELPALAVESYPGLYLLPHPHPDLDFACAVPEAFPLTRSSCGGLRGDGAVTQQRSFPGHSREPGATGRALALPMTSGGSQGQGGSCPASPAVRCLQKRTTKHLEITATASLHDFCTWPSLAAAPGPVRMCPQ